MSTATLVSERARAKQIITEIIRQAGGKLASKVELLRVFWRAHLVFAESQPGYLSFWPILKTPTGPVINDVDLLLGELVTEGVLQIDETRTGGEPALQLELTGQAGTGEETAVEAIDAIQHAIANPNQPIDLGDYHSLRSWNAASDGEELNIYVDVIPAAEYAERQQRLQEMAYALKSAWE